MINKKEVIVIIPARSGSKGLKNKNILELDGKPLLSWPIVSSLGSKYVDRTIVSTDSLKYSKIANHYGAETPFLRPKDISHDHTSSIEVILHAIDNAVSNDCIIILLEPTSPFTTCNDIDSCLEEFIESKQCTSLVGLMDNEKYHPEYSLLLNDENLIENYKNTVKEHIPRQKLKKNYYPDGSIYISWSSELVKRKTFYHDKTFGFVFPKHKNIEIDDIHDFMYAKSLLKYFYENK